MIPKTMESRPKKKFTAQQRKVQEDHLRKNSMLTGTKKASDLRDLEAAKDSSVLICKELAWVPEDDCTERITRSEIRGNILSKVIRLKDKRTDCSSDQ
jgi:hypothetical protein